ncbi:MAG TPA: DUF362 domain-containing protein [Bryobacteraceae bacterium]|nr:DUF362 domain-containing protein [Bryobacteraceae bacterium]
MRPGASRRTLLRACLAGALSGRAAVPAKSKVAIARDPMIRRAGSSPDSTRLLLLLDRAVQSVYDADSPSAAWKKIARPGETVGLKVNCLAGRGSASTSPVLVEAICERLQQAGVRQQDLIVWDRLTADMEHAGFPVTARKDRIRYLGNDAAGYETDLAIFGSVGSLLSRTITQICDAVINLPVLKDHGIVGVTMALKNLFGAIHNPNKYHLDTGDPYVADVYMLSPIRQKVRLTICEAVSPQFEGGPSYMPQWAWPFNGVIVSRDPVALDYIGWQIIEQKRAEQGLPTLRHERREPVYIARAADAQHRIGTNDPAAIDRVEI